MQWVVDLETSGGAVADDAAFEVVADALHAAVDRGDCLLGFHPERRSVAVWIQVDAESASGALDAAESAVALALREAGTERPPPIASAIVKRWARVI